MNLFDTIGLKADPFSTSPNVDLFYPAAEHRQCLEGLELAIRMRRGLSVVRGGIGVGKTTISRKLIQNFKNESDDFVFHLILDPKFESEIILLKHIIELFGPLLTAPNTAFLAPPMSYFCIFSVTLVICANSKHPSLSGTSSIATLRPHLTPPFWLRGPFKMIELTQ